MVQVLPYVPSALEQLTPYINQAAQGIGAGIEKRRNQREWERFITPPEAQANSNPATGAPNANPQGQQQQNAPNQTPMSPLDQMISKPGGPSLGEVQAIVSAAEKASPGSGKIVADYISDKVKSSDKEQRDIRKQEREILSISPKKYFENVENYRAKSRDIDLALNAEMDAIFNGEVDPFSSGHIAEVIKQFDLPPGLAAPLETVGSKQFRTGQKTFLTNTFNDAFRGATTKGQIELASSLLAETGAPRESNLASIYFLQAQHMVEKERLRLTDEATEEGISPLKIPKYVDKKLDAYAKYINDQYFIEVQNLRKEAKK